MTDTVTPLPEPALRRPVFTVEGRVFRWEDVVLAAKAEGEWAACEHAAREGLACLRHAAETGADLTGSEFDAQERAFRRARRLLAAEELHAWLASRDLQVAGWREALRGAVLRSRWSDELESMLELETAEVDLQPAVWAYANCSGRLEEVARRLAGHAAVAAAGGQLAPGDRRLDESELQELGRCFERFAGEVATSQAIEREVERHRLEWLRLEWRYQAATDPEVLREVALCIREDGMSLEAAALAAGVVVETCEAELERIDIELGTLLMSASIGALLGPVEVEGEHRLIEVLARRPPTSEDPRTREMARAAVLEHSIETEVVNRVRWDEHL